MAHERDRNTTLNPGQQQQEKEQEQEQEENENEQKEPRCICINETRVNRTPGQFYGQTYNIHKLTPGCPYCNTRWFDSPTRAPLFYWPIANAPVSEKLARMREALDAGADPNEVDHSRDWRHQHGRPLNMCISEGEARGNGQAIYENAPVIELLLQYGADPRLYGVPNNPYLISSCYQPVMDAKACMEGSRESKYATPEQIEFFTSAYQLMKDAADKLDQSEMQQQPWATRLLAAAQGILGNTSRWA